MTSKYSIFKRFDWWFSDNVRRPIKTVYLRLKYKIAGGYPCANDYCDNKLRFKTFQVSGTIGPNKTRMLLSNSGKLYCPHCLDYEIEEYFERTTDFKIGTCDATGEHNVKTIDIVWGHEGLGKKLGIDLRFGTHWWNGFNISYPAFQELLRETGYLETNVIRVGKDGTYKCSDGVILADKQSVKEYT